MKLFLCAIVLSLALPALAQQQAAPPLPPGTTPPTFPPDNTNPGREMPPDSRAPKPVKNAPKPAANEAVRPSLAELQEQIQKKLDSEPGLTKANLQAQVKGNTIVLSGAVVDEQQHETARRIAQSYAGDHKLVDRVTVGQRPEQR